MLFQKKEFILEDVVKQNKLYPRKFMKPTAGEISGLKVGDTVKLIFVMTNPKKSGCRGERMWVKITQIDNEHFYGKLNNQPCYLNSIQAGDTIEFFSKNIAAVILHQKPQFDEKKFAIITKRALEKREINWLVKTQDTNNEQDSGWQLFYGDEDDEYLDHSENAEIISLEAALSFEPLLENIFGQNGNAYEYSKKENMFVEIEDWAIPE